MTREVFVGSVGHGVQWDRVTEYHVVPVHRAMCKYTIIPSSPCPTEPTHTSHYIQADVSKIEALASMVGSSEPNFVFYMDGEKLGDTIKGCNSPVLSDIIYKKLGIEG